MQTLKSWWRNDSGQFAVLTAVVSVPLLICAAVALESTTQIRQTRNLQSALDSAALAAVSPGNLSVKEREAFAETVFAQNFTSDNTSVEVTATDSRVDIMASVTTKPMFGNVLSKSDYQVSRKATAIRTTEDVVCVMTLDQHGSGSLSFEKDARFNAPGCSVQVNSDSRHALKATGNYKPTARSMCVVGGATGALPKELKTGCSPIEDPYHGKSYKPTGMCDYGPVSYFDFTSYQDVMVVGEPDRVLKPGVFCGGLHIYDSSVKLEPGTYIMQDGALTVGHNSKVVGEGVTFVFSGTQSVLYTYENVEMDLTAPTSGPFAGLIFFQNRNSSMGETSIIKGGVNMRLVGTTYFPTQNLFVGGVGVMGSSSPAMAFIANNITFTSDIEKVISANEAYILETKQLLELVVGLAYNYGVTDYQASAVATTSSAITDFTTSIATDNTSHQGTGIPPILPRSDAGARLISTQKSEGL